MREIEGTNRNMEKIYQELREHSKRLEALEKKLVEQRKLPMENSTRLQRVEEKLEKHDKGLTK